MLNVFLLSLLAIAVSPVAAQDLTDGAIAGIAVGSVVGAVLILLLVVICCWAMFNQPQDPGPIIMRQPGPVIQVPGPEAPPRIITRIFPHGGGPPIIREGPLGPGPIGPGPIGPGPYGPGPYGPGPYGPGPVPIGGPGPGFPVFNNRPPVGYY